MATIAHISDLHLVEDCYQKRPVASRTRLSYLSFGRPLVPDQRRSRVASALREVRNAGVDHLVITGDLTEDGEPAQFEILAELLASSRIPADRITIVPGNHDAYSDGAHFAQAMAGPLRDYARTSESGKPITFGDMTLVPVSTAFHQSPLRSAGAIAASELDSLCRLAVDPALRGRPLVFVQHHPPGRSYAPPLQWVDGLLEHSTLSALFERAPHLYVVHGHTHRAVNRPACSGEAARIFSAKAVVDSPAPVRLYDASPAGLTPLAADLVDGIGAVAAALA
jgi:3',5'-cyclic-AMP phosphodiesterase